MESFTNLLAWKTGMRLTKEIYSLTEEFPSAERFGLISQLRRASVSVLANLAEGFSRSTMADKAHKYTIARGECTEVSALLMISEELGLLEKQKVSKALTLTSHTGRLLSGLIQKYSPNPSPNPIQIIKT